MHARSFLVDAIENPEQGRQRLPYVLSLAESDDRMVRWAAVTTCCLIAVEEDDEDIVEYLIRRFIDRLDGTANLELTTALDYLSAHFERQVETLLADLEDADRPLPRVGNFTRAYYYRHDHTRGDVGRTRLAVGQEEDDPRQLYANRQREERDRRHRERERTSGDDDDPAGDGVSVSGSGGDEEMIRQTTDLSEITVRSRFDQLHVRGEHRRGRYADTYETLVGDGTEQRAVSLRLFHRPAATGEQHAFEQGLSERLEAWSALENTDHIVSVLDWGLSPRPWVATDMRADSLAEHDRPNIETVAELGAGLFDALVRLHQNDVVHGGLDPSSVVYASNSFSETARTVPKLDNVGLMHVFRHHFQPSQCLDPQFAAPEYYDDQFGRIDHKTDIYQFGAVCYYLLTGRAPFADHTGNLRDAVLNGIPPAPSTLVDNVPSGFDGVLQKAMAKQKLRRYETAEQFAREFTDCINNA